MKHNPTDAIGNNLHPQDRPLAAIRTAQPRLVRNAAHEAIRDAIIYGRLKPGERLIERKLCESTGVGRSSIREVIRLLEADRLVTVTAHHGPTVTRLTLDQAQEIYEIRADLEARLARSYCVHATDSDLARIQKFLPEIKGAASKRDKHALVEIMLRFNGHIADAARLEVTSDLLRVLLARISWLRVHAMTAPDRIAKSTVEISCIVEALQRRNPQDAEKAVRRYVANAGLAALEQMRRQ